MEVCSLRMRLILFSFFFLFENYNEKRFYFIFEQFLNIICIFFIFSTLPVICLCPISCVSNEGNKSHDITQNVQTFRYWFADLFCGTCTCHVYLPFSFSLFFLFCFKQKKENRSLNISRPEHISNLFLWRCALSPLFHSLFSLIETS